MQISVLDGIQITSSLRTHHRAKMEKIERQMKVEVETSIVEALTCKKAVDQKTRKCTSQMRRKTTRLVQAKLEVMRQNEDEPLTLSIPCASTTTSKNRCSPIDCQRCVDRIAESIENCSRHISHLRAQQERFALVCYQLVQQEKRWLALDKATCGYVQMIPCDETSAHYKTCVDVIGSNRPRSGSSSHILNVTRVLRVQNETLRLRYVHRNRDKLGCQEKLLLTRPLLDQGRGCLEEVCVGGFGCASSADFNTPPIHGWHQLHESIPESNDESDDQTILVCQVACRFQGSDFGPEESSTRRSTSGVWFIHDPSTVLPLYVWSFPRIRFAWEN